MATNIKRSHPDNGLPGLYPYPGTRITHFNRVQNQNISPKLPSTDVQNEKETTAMKIQGNTGTMPLIKSALF